MWQAAHAPATMSSCHGGPYPQIMIQNKALLCWLGRVFFKMAIRKVTQMGLIPAGFYSCHGFRPRAEHALIV